MVYPVRAVLAKYEKDVECGGRYLKTGPKPDDLKTFGYSTLKVVT